MKHSAAENKILNKEKKERNKKSKVHLIHIKKRIFCEKD